MPPVKRSSIAAAVAALALLAACGGDDATPGSTTTTVEEAGGSDGSATTAPGDGDGGEPGDVTAEELLEAVEATRAAGSATVELALGFDGGELLGSQSVSIGGPATFDGSRADLTVSANGEADTLRILVDDDQSWMGGHGDDVRGALPEGADWVEIPADDLRAAQSYSNPGDLAFLYLVGGAQDIEATDDGYRFDIDLDAAVASAPEELKEEVASNLSFSGSLAPEITGEVVLDDEGRVTSLAVVGIQRPSAEEVEQMELAPDTEIRIELDATLEDFDEDFDVEEPDGEVVPLSEAPQVAALLGIEGAGASGS